MNEWNTYMAPQKNFDFSLCCTPSERWSIPQICRCTVLPAETQKQKRRSVNIYQPWQQVFVCVLLLSVVKTGIPLTLEGTTASWGPKCWTPLYKSIHFRVKLWVKLMVSVKLRLQSIFTLMVRIRVIFKNKTLILYLIISLLLLSCFLTVMHLKAGCQPPWNKERRHSN